MVKYIRIFLFSLLLLLSHTALADLTAFRGERRGVWVTTIYNLDFPIRPGNGVKAATQQQAELNTLIDNLAKANFNTLFLQVRLRGTVIYPSTYEPWDRCMTGQFGVAPVYDPLAYAIEACHKRGIHLHAWFVVLPLGTTKQAQQLGKTAVQRRMPALCLQHRGEWYMNPGHPSSSDYLTRLVGELVEKYDLDGIHFDYIRYPDQPNGYTDNTLYRKYGKGVAIGDWRRANITNLVSRLYDESKRHKPWIEVSSSVIGRHRLESLPGSKGGFMGFETVSQDAVEWIRRGKHDFIVPMTYYQDPLFTPILRDWGKRIDPKCVASGIGVSYMEEKERNWSIESILSQLRTTRDLGLQGAIYFRARTLLTNNKGILDSLRTNYYSQPTFFPPKRPLPSSSAAAPTHINMSFPTLQGTILRWDRGDNSNLRYVIWGKRSQTDQYEPLYLTVAGVTAVYLPLFDLMRFESFIIRSVDSEYRQSEPSEQINSIW